MKHTLITNRTAHVQVLEPTQKCTRILFALHGYAQLAEDFIQQFEPLTKAGYMVIAPEALSKFYNKFNQPVANWMTSHERQDEINDYINYLDLVAEQFFSNQKQLPISLLGFSQGVSTLLRWASSTTLKIQSIHLIAGSIPPDLSALHKFQAVPFHYYYGNSDKLLTPPNASKQIELLQNLGVHVQSHRFEGRHEIPNYCIEQLLN